MFPDFLYKYRCWTDNNHKKILTNNEIYFSSAKDFNDPFDSSYPVRYDRSSKKEIWKLYFKHLSEGNPNLSREGRRQLTTKKIREKKYKDPNHIKGSYEFQKNYRYNQFGIFSLTEIYDNIIMWSHYSDSHKGFCIGLNINNLLSFCKNELFIQYLNLTTDLKKVDYQKDYPFFNGLKMNDYDLTIIPFITKSDSWEYEKEYRLILFDYTNRSIKLKDGIISKVYLGCRMPDNHKEEIKKILIDKKTNIELFQAKMKEESFGLDFERISY